MSFERSSRLDDFLASIVVFLVALPLCMGIAIASGTSPTAGLITGIVGGLVVGVIAGSPLQVSGPAAGLAVMVWDLVQRFGLETLGVVVLLAGAIQLIAGALKLGQWFRAVPPSLIQGMLAGIGALIFASQLYVMLDQSPAGSGIKNLIGIPGAIAGLFDLGNKQHALAAWTGALTIASIVLWNSFRPRRLVMIPAPLVGVIVGTAFAWAFGFGIRKVEIPAQVFASLQLLSWEGFSSALSWPVVGSAVALAFVASAESLLCATAVDQMHTGERTRYSKELAAQGIGNMICGVLGALPMTGVIVRSTANVQAGASTRLSAILHGAWILLFVAFLPGVLNVIPTAALAAILVFTGYKLLNLKVIKQLRKHGYGEVVIYLVTLVTIVATDLLTGVIAGFVVSLMRTLLARGQLTIETTKDPVTGATTEIHLSGAATFFQLPKLAAALERVPLDAPLIIHVERLQFIDHACLDLIESRERFGSKTRFDKARLLQLSPGLNRKSA